MDRAGGGAGAAVGSSASFRGPLVVTNPLMAAGQVRTAGHGVVREDTVLLTNSSGEKPCGDLVVRIRVSRTGTVPQ